MEEEPETKLFNFLTECFFHEEFKKTHFARQVGLGALALTWSYFRIFNFYHPAKVMITASVALGGIINTFHSFSKEIYEISRSDTLLAGRLRLYHQNASYNNVFIPYFKGETNRVSKIRGNPSNNQENLNKTQENTLDKQENISNP